MRYRRTAIAILMAFSTLCMAQQSLNNDTITKMHSAGLGDDIIISTINSQPGTYLVSADDLVVLKKAGISDTVIGAMISKIVDQANGPSAQQMQELPQPQIRQRPAQLPVKLLHLLFGRQTRRYQNREFSFKQ